MIVFKWLPVLLLFPLPWLLRALLSRANTESGQRLMVPFFNDIEPLSALGSSQSKSKPWPLRLAFWLVWLALVLAAAGPQYIGEPISMTTKARDLMLAVDVSESMRVKDLRLASEQVDRLAVVKNVLGDFIGRRNGDRLGLILFGSQAYLQTPLTLDRATVELLLMESQIGIAGPKTAIGDAIGLALKRLQDKPNESKVMILLTDGANTAGEIQPLQAAELAAQKGLKIYTIGVGAEEMSLPGIFGSNFGARRINPSADLDEGTLTKIAELTGGQYFRAKSTESLRHIYELIDELEPIDADEQTYRPIKALFQYPLAFALLLSALLSIQSLIGKENLYV